MDHHNDAQFLSAIRAHRAAMGLCTFQAYIILLNVLKHTFDQTPFSCFIVAKELVPTAAIDVYQLSGSQKNLLSSNSCMSSYNPTVYCKGRNAGFQTAFWLHLDVFWPLCSALQLIEKAKKGLFRPICKIIFAILEFLIIIYLAMFKPLEQAFVKTFLLTKKQPVEK